MALIKKRKSHMLEIGLNITSLIDVLTVLLFFLVKSMSVTNSAVKPPPDVRLPAAITSAKVHEATSVSLSSHELRVNSRLVLKLQDGKFGTSQINRNDETIKALKAVLLNEREKKLRLFAGMAGKKFLAPGKILIQADKNLPFDTIKYLLHTAAVAGYTDYRFVVIQKSST